MGQLTPTELRIRELAAAGFSNKEAAAQLGLSHRTVEDHRLKIFRKMGVRNVVEMVRMMAAMGELPE